MRILLDEPLPIGLRSEIPDHNVRVDWTITFALIESLDGETDTGADEAWQVEIDRRIAEIGGEVRLILPSRPPWQRDKLARRRRDTPASRIAHRGGRTCRELPC